MIDALKMHDCAQGREGGPSARRVEHRYAGERISNGSHLKHHIHLKPLQQFKKSICLFGVFCEKRFILHCEFVTKIEKSHIFEKNQ